MKFPRNPALVLASAALLFSAQSVADHNSKNGEGWANMPNDIHNTRIDTRAADDFSGETGRPSRTSTAWCNPSRQLRSG